MAIEHWLDRFEREREARESEAEWQEPLADSEREAFNRRTAEREPDSQSKSEVKP